MDITLAEKRMEIIEYWDNYVGDLTNERTPDSVRQYFQEIGRIPRISHEREIELSRLIQNGDRVAWNELVISNLKLVVSIARIYSGRMEFLDLIQEGNIGLMLAASKYDYKRGTRFSTYAVWWIKQAILRGIANYARTIRIPVYMIGKVTILRETENELNEKFGRDGTTKEIASSLGWDEKTIELLRSLRDITVSLDVLVGDDKEIALRNLTPTLDEESQTENWDRQMVAEKIWEIMMKRLNPVEVKVIALRFGLFDGRERTLQEIGEEFELSRERIRQIEAKAIRQLKMFLKDFV